MGAARPPPKPCALLNVEGYYEGVAGFLAHAVEERFLPGGDPRPAHGRARVRPALIERLQAFEPRTLMPEVDRPGGDLTTGSNLPRSMADPEIGEILVQPDELAHRVSELAEQISKDYAGKDVLLIGVLKGAVFFLADLMRKIDVDCEVDFMAVSSYGSSTDSSGVVRILKDLDASIEGRHVLIVEDIVDSGLTLSYLFRMLGRPRTRLARGLRPAHEARAARGGHADSLRRLRDPEQVRHRLRAGSRRALPQPAVRGGSERALSSPFQAPKKGITPLPHCYACVSLACRYLALSRFFKSAAFPILIVVVLAFFAQKLISPGDKTEPPPYSQFLQQVDRGQVKSATLSTKNNRVDVELKGGEKYQTAYPDNTEQNLVNQLRGEDVRVDVKPKGGSGWLTALTYILPFVIFLLFWLFIINQMQGGGSKVMSFGKSRAKRMSVDAPKITFRDVAGVDEAVEELHEIKEFLENPKKFQALGARIPKGVLLYGPPGTGKTLLARAVARRGRRSVLLDLRVGLRRDVRRGRRLARA